MRITYDRQARALYVSVQPAATVARTKRLDDQCLVDYGAGGGVVGIEILDADEPTSEDISRGAAPPAYQKIGEAIAYGWDGGKSRAFAALLPYIRHLGNCGAADANPTDDRCSCGLRQVWRIRETPE